MIAAIVALGIRIRPASVESVIPGIIVVFLGGRPITSVVGSRYEIGSACSGEPSGTAGQVVDVFQLPDGEQIPSAAARRCRYIILGSYLECPILAVCPRLTYIGLAYSATVRMAAVLA